MTTKTLEAKFAGKCAQCPTRIQPGDPILWDGTGSTRHVECPAPVEEPVQAAGPTRKEVVAKVHALMLGARSAKLRWPKIRLRTTEGRDIVLSISGGGRPVVWVNPARGVPSGRVNDCLGRITSEGWWQYHGIPADVEAVVRGFAENPESTARVYGRMTSSCCFCGRSLSDKRSTQIGYGPICAEHYSLPWGEAPAPVEEAKVDQPASENCFEDWMGEDPRTF